MTGIFSPTLFFFLHDKGIYHHRRADLKSSRRAPQHHPLRKDHLDCLIKKVLFGCKRKLMTFLFVIIPKTPSFYR
ncbi:Hypothetical protein FKW44_007611, partial [Caligus rogercresseyi]